MLVEKKTNIYHAIELSSREISYVLYAHALTRSFARANDAKIVRSRNANAKLGNHLNDILKLVALGTRMSVNKTEILPLVAF